MNHGPLWGVELVTRVLGALALLAGGAVHLQQYLKLYSDIPTIGKLFLVDFALSTALGLALLAPLERLLGRWGGPAVVLLSVAGIGLSGGAYVMLLVSQRMPLFGFQEPGYDPTAITAAQAAEISAVVLLGASLVARFVTRSSDDPEPQELHP